MYPTIPGSRRDRINEPDDPTSAGLSSGRFTEAQLILMTELIEWWSYRRSQNDAANPVQSLIGGVDIKGTARTTGLTPATATLNLPITTPVEATGSSYIIHAFGIPDPDNVGEVYSLTSLCHFYYVDSAYLARYTTIARAPSSPTTTEIRTSTNMSGDAIVSVIGVDTITIDWTINVIRLEL